jgi:hypothetical protein
MLVLRCVHAQFNSHASASFGADATACTCGVFRSHHLFLYLRGSPSGQLHRRRSGWADARIWEADEAPFGAAALSRGFRFGSSRLEVLTMPREWGAP